MRGRPKHYALDTAFAPCWYPPFDLPEPLPQTLAPLTRRQYRLPMCAEPTDRGLGLTVQVVVQGPAAPSSIGVSFNGSWPTFACETTRELLFPNRPATQHLPGHQALNFRLDVAKVREGWNEIALYNEPLSSGAGSRRHLTTYDPAALVTPSAAAAPPGSVRVVSIELAIR
jgi:hypothetical protein